MNVPPAPPPPMSPIPPMPMDAPPPKKSGALKWILIGCGAFAFLGILACGGCFLVGIMVVKGVINEGVAKVKPIIASNETVKSEIGELRSISPRWEVKTDRHNGHEAVNFTLDVEGDKGKGTVLVKMFGHERKKNEVYVMMTFVNASGSKQTPIGTWRVYDDGKGNAGFTPVTELPPDLRDPGTED